MSNRITWIDRLLAVPRNARRDPIAALAMILAIAAVVLCLTGCGQTIPSVPTIAGPPPLLGPPAPKPGSVEAKDQELAGAIATVARLTHERDELRLAPLRTSLAWVDGIALIGMLAGVGLAIAALFWGLGFTWKIPAGGALACGSILATSLATSWALGHVAWIIGGVLALAAAGIAWAIRKHLTLIGAARKAWEAAPDSVDLGPKAEALFARLIAKANVAPQDKGV